MADKLTELTVVPGEPGAVDRGGVAVIPAPKRAPKKPLPRRVVHGAGPARVEVETPDGWKPEK